MSRYISCIKLDLQEVVVVESKKRQTLAPRHDGWRDDRLRVVTRL